MTMIYIFLGENDQFDINVVIRNENTREHILNCHEQIKNISLDELEPWRGWPQNSSTACRDVACTIASNIDKSKMHISLFFFYTFFNVIL